MKDAALFIGSSVEGLDVAYALQELLSFDCEPTVWTQDVFKPSRTALSDLFVRSRASDLAAFVFTADDILQLRGEAVAAPRDNVVFELGLFVGALSPDRCFIVQPFGSELHLPTDLIGMAPLNYLAARKDGNLIAALGPAANQIRRQIRAVSVDPRIAEEVARRAAPVVAAPSDSTELQAYIDMWDGPLKPVRESLKSVPFDSYDEDMIALRPAMRRIFAFLESLAAAVLDGKLPEQETRTVFGEAVDFTWPNLATLLAPPNHVDDFWTPSPRISELYLRWRKPT